MSEQEQQKHVVRDNPKRTTKLREERASYENVCKLCGRGFQSSKALFGHMKYHAEKLVVNTQSDGNEEPDASWQCSRRRSKKMTRCKTIYSSENEREDVARSLMMLSKELCSDDEEIVSDEICSSKKAVHDADELGFDKRANKRNKFQCGTCNRIFQSHQALGGHRASHKKIKGCYASKFDQVSSNGQEQAHFVTTENQESHDIMTHGPKKDKSVKNHECPFCYKVFASGQALGGHKRSHLLNSSGINSNQSTVVQEHVSKARELIDLNLPATTVEDTPSPVTDFSETWWPLGRCVRPESPIEFSP